jgi:cytochrome c
MIARIFSILALSCAAPGAFAAGDEAKGQAFFNNACLHCHAPGRAGPPYTGLIGRKAGTVPGFAYSEALRNANITWTEETLDTWLSGPDKLVPGTFMGVTIRNPEDRANVIAYLKVRK